MHDISDSGYLALDDIQKDFVHVVDQIEKNPKKVVETRAKWKKKHEEEAKEKDAGAKIEQKNDEEQLQEHKYILFICFYFLFEQFMHSFEQLYLF